MLILVVLLAVTHAFVPVLGQTTDSAASNSQKQADSRNQDQKPAPAVSRVKSQDKSSSIRGTESNKRPDDYQQPTINVTNPAPMPESWSWHDKIAWGASLLLLVVAAVTLRWFIIQTNATKKAADAALLNAQAVQFGGGKSIYIYGRIQYLPMPEMPGSLADPWETRYCRWYVPIDIPTFADGRCPKEYTLYK